MKEAGFTKLQRLILCAMFTALIAVGGMFLKFTIPAFPVEMHFTLQWFFVIMAAMIMEPGEAFASVAVYLLLGLAGIPVFASGGGPAYVLKPTFGYLLGFAAAAWCMSYLRCRMNIRSFEGLLAASTVGLLIYYGIGILYFAAACSFWVHKPLSLKIILFNCFFMTVGEDFILCAAAAAVCRRLNPVVRRMFIA